MADEVQFQSPTTGATQVVPPEQWDAALKAGYTPTTHKVLYSPEGQRGMVPNAELADHVKSGFQTTPPSQFEKQNKLDDSITSPFDEGATNPVSRIASAAGGGVLGFPGSLLHAIVHPLDTAKSADDSLRTAIDYYSGNPTWSGIKSVLPEAIGGGIGTVLGGELASKLPGEVGDARNAVSRAVYENGEVKPSIKDWGEAIRHPTQLPGKVITSTAKAAFPPPPEYPGAQLPSVDEFYENRGNLLNDRGAEQAALDKQYTSEGKAIPLSRSPYAANYKQDLLSGQSEPISQGPNYTQNQALIDLENEARKPVPITQSPYYNQTQDALAADAEARKPVAINTSPNYVINKDRALTGQTTSLSDSPYAPRYKAAAKDLEAFPLSQSPNARTYPSASTLDEVYGPQVNASSTDPYAPTGSPDDLISRTKKIVVPGEAPSAADLKRAGDLTQAPLPRLKQLASFGDELAKNEINRRLRNQ